MKLPNGYGSVYKLSGNRRNPWVACVTIGYNKETRNQERRVIGYFPNKPKALNALADYNQNPFDVDSARRTFSEIHELWYKEFITEDTNPNTKRQYNAAYKRCSMLYNRKMSDIKIIDMQRVLDNCNNGYQSVRRIKILLNKIYEYCIFHDMLHNNLAEKLKINAKSDETKRARREFSESEINLLWEYSNLDSVKIVLMLIYSGVRVSELLDLKISNVNLDEQTFFVESSKTDSGVRTVPIADKVLPFWQKFISDSQCGYVLNNTNGKPLKYDNFKRNYWTPLQNDLGLDHTIHETRHTCISMLVSANVNHTIIKKIVGHKSKMDLTEKVYTHINPKELVNAINKI